MIRTKILGLGSYVPERVVTNEELAFFNDQHVRQETIQTETNDEWIQKRTGIKERRYVPNDGSWSTSDLALPLSWSANGLIIEQEDASILRVRDNVPLDLGAAPARFLRGSVTQP